MFSKTLKENIALGRKDANDAEINEAVRIASIHDVIKSFEKGYDTPVGERGVTLSGGQEAKGCNSQDFDKKQLYIDF